MKKSVSLWDFHDAFLKSDTYKNNFSYEGLTALFEYLEEYEASTGEEIDFDMITLCCEYSEYGSAIEAYNNHNRAEHNSEKLALEWLEEHTQVIPFDGGIIIQEF